MIMKRGIKTQILNYSKNKKFTISNKFPKKIL